LVFVLLIAPGCGKSNPYEVAPVTGRVTLDGKALTDGMVTFVPDRSQETVGPIGVARIQRDGTYRIVTDPGGDARDGAVVGFHRIRVRPRVVFRAESAKQPVTYPFPAVFTSELTSGLTAEVEPGIDNMIDVDMESPIPVR